jgi:hypothetical protein
VNVYNILNSYNKYNKLQIGKMAGVGVEWGNREYYGELNLV